MRGRFIVVAALLLVSGCGGTPPRVVTVDSAAPVAPQGAAHVEPVIDVVTATGLIEQLAKKNNRANSALDPSQLDGYETEAAHTMDRAELTAPDPGRSPRPFTYDLTGTRVPERGVADWFIGETTITGSGNRYPLIFRLDGETWKLAHYAPVTAALPETEQDARGNAEVIDAADPGRTLIMSPRQAAEAHARSIGDTVAAGAPLAGDPVTATGLPTARIRSMIRFQDGPARSVTWSTRVGGSPVRALRTADGGALVAYSTVTTFLGRSPGRKAVVPARYGRLGSAGVGQQKLDVMSMWWAWIPAGRVGDKIKVLGGISSLIKIS